ncbi:MAG: GTPase ObgE [bacterium]|nr:GTPase ObgE [bacterium]MDT8365704.1 GTPase ObgE [bacterium]
MSFIDRVKIFVESGAGGNGCVSFRREKFVPRGGPDGGDGGRGGDVFIRTDPQLSTLIDFRYKREYRAGTGAHGRGSKMTGKDGDPVVLRVPPGTQIMDASTGELLADLTEGEFIPAKGGRGGRGNSNFATPTRQAPRISEEGRYGQARDLVLELKLIADVGIVGLPNAGKSTLISRISAARPKIADYPFTTLVPNLGVVRVDDDRSFVVADVPGLVEGAHQGVGLGHQFLRHVERTSVILHLVGLAPGDGDPVEAYRTIRQELGQYADDLARKDFIVALSKADVVSPEERESILAKFQEDTGIRPMLISAAVGEGLTPLVGKLSTMIEKLKEKGND